LDTGHFRFGGGNSIEALKKYSERIWHVHFKDCDDQIAEMSREKKWDYFKSVENGVFCELGKGSCDFKSVIEELNKMNYNGWIVVEQDVLPGMGKPKECALHNREFIITFGL
jgi:inosose dehydratase